MATASLVRLRSLKRSTLLRLLSKYCQTIKTAPEMKSRTIAHEPSLKHGDLVPETKSVAVALTFWICIGSGFAVSLYASVQARGLYSDGVAYLVGIYQDHWFLLFDTRTIVQLLRQAPVVFASRYTSASLFQCAQLFSFLMLALPWAFCALCWFVLPSNRKTWMAFPILATLSGWMATSVHAVGEAAIATSYEWLVLLVVLFRANRAGWMLLWIVLLAPAFRLHEGTFPFLAVIAVSAAVAILDARSWPIRMLLSFGFLILVCTIADQLYWVVHPQFPRDRDAITEGLLNGEFLYYDGHFNLQLINGAVALLVIVLLGLVEVFSARKAAESCSGELDLLGTVLCWLCIICIDG